MASARTQTRRQFLAAGVGASLTAWGAPALLRAGSPNERLRLAFIGAGGRGGRNLNELAMTRSAEAPQGRAARSPQGVPRTDVEVVALCDVNRQNLDRAAQLFSGARTYTDFRRLLDELHDVDGVVVSTTEHTHAYATLPALQQGKHVYCEKPLTLNVHEARIVTQAAAQARVATQMGTQNHANPNYHRVVELIQSNAIGPVHEVHVWVSRAWGWQSREEADANKDIVFVQDRPTEVMTPPESLDWDLWLGPAPERPYHEVYFPGPKWYRWWDFGNGTMSDLGSHWNDLPYWALKLNAPRTIEAYGPPPHPEIAPASMTATYEYGPRGSLPACRLSWYQGTHKPQIWKDGGIPNWTNGVLFVGSQGMLLADYGKHVLLPEESFKDFTPPPASLSDQYSQHEEWLMACRTGSPTGSHFGYAGPLTEANHLGNVAYRAGKRIEWNTAEMRITNDIAANQYLGREPRRGWRLL
jgi:hypothetical protein